MNKQNVHLTYFNGYGLEKIKPLKEMVTKESISKPKTNREVIKYPCFPYIN